MFRVLVLAMAGILLLKATIALAIPGRFYAERRRQYASPTLPRKVLVGPIVIAGLAATAWYATVVRYEPWGWVVAACLTAFAGAALRQLLFRWETHRQRMALVVADPKVWRIDCCLLGAGLLLATAALTVFD